MNINEYLNASERTEKKFTSGEFLNNDQMELLHGVMGLVTESGELMDVVKKNLIYNKDVDLVNVREELGDIMWYWALVCRLYGWSPEEVMRINIDKLKHRYPEKFSETRALNRDIIGERDIIE